MSAGSIPSLSASAVWNATAHALPLVTASIERLRMEAARRLLSETRTTIKRIAQRCGFGLEETMRRSFLRMLSVTPKTTALDLRFQRGFCHSATLCASRA